MSIDASGRESKKHAPTRDHAFYSLFQGAHGKFIYFQSISKLFLQTNTFYSRQVQLG